MQGSSGTTGSLQESIYYDLVSSSSDASIDQQVFWNDSTNPVDWLPNFSLSPNDTNITHSNSADQGGNNLNPWSLGESGFDNSQNEIGCVEPKTEHDWPPSPKFGYGPQNILSMDDVNLSFHSNGIADIQLLPSASHSNSLTENFDMDSSIHANSEDDCQIIETINEHNTSTSLNIRALSSSSSPIPDGLHSRDGNDSVDARPDFSLQGRQLSHKRKAFEFSGQTSIDGALPFQQTPWDDTSAQTSTRNSSRNTRWRSGTSYPEFTNTYLSTRDIGNEHPRIPSIGPPERLLPINHSTNLGSNQTPYDEGDAHSPNHSFVVHIPPVPQSALSFRRNGASTSAPESSSSHVISEFRDATPNEDPIIRNIRRRNIERSLFIPTTTLNYSTQDSRDWNPASRSISIPGDITPNVHTGSHSGINLSSSNHALPHRNTSSSHQRQLTEMVRRQLLSTDSESSRQNQRSFQSGFYTPAREMMAPLVGGSSILGPSSLMDRPLNEIRGFQNSLRNFHFSSDGRSRLLSEIHSALESVRGENLRFHERFFNSFAEAHDRHRDMRLDVDSMSYEELLALEERMGYVNTGLSEEAISKKLKIYKYCEPFLLVNGMKMEPCCICREDYGEGDEMRALECVHEFHAECIKKWLIVKNQCPICKKTALTKP